MTIYATGFLLRIDRREFPGLRARPDFFFFFFFFFFYRHVRENRTPRGVGLAISEQVKISILFSATREIITTLADGRPCILLKLHVEPD